MTYQRRFAAALLASTMLGAPTAFAQDSGETEIEDVIIVNATRRASDVQDVPIAVTVVTPAALERQGVVNIKDLASVASGFNIQSSQTETQGTSIRIRGVGTTGNNIGLESAVGVFIDGVYQSRPGVALGELIDIEAIEMLRGPQGTLFGRNVTAGALNIRTAAPNFDGFEGMASFTYGNYDLFNLQGMINTPVSDTLAVRLTGSYRQRDGFLTSSVDPDAESSNRDRFILRGQALWEPTDVTSLRLIADYQEVDENCCAAVTLTASPLLSAATRNAIFPALGFEDSLEEQVFNDQEFGNIVENWNLSAELNHDFGNVTATAIVAYSDFLGSSIQQEFNGGRQYSVAGDTIPEANRTSFDDIQTLTAELRFQGEAMDGRLDWLVGGFFADEQIVEEFTLGLGPDYTRLVSEANTGDPTLLATFAGIGGYLLQGGDSNPNAVFAPNSGAGQFGQNRFEQDAQSFSVFTHNIFALTDEIDLTLGARYIDDSKDGSFDQVATGGDLCLSSASLLGGLVADPAGTVALIDGLGAGAVGLATSPLNGTLAFLNCFPFSAPAIGATAPASFGAFGFFPEEYSDNFSDEELIYTARIGWEPDPDLLFFASLTHGYKAGGFNLDASAGAGGADPRFASEEIDAYEAGMKYTFADGRMRFNVTAFWQDMNDFQVLEFTGTRFQTFNVQDVSSKGVEVELNGRLTDYLFLNSGVTYANAGYGSNCDDNGTIVEALGLCDNSLTNAPDFSGVFGLTYDGPLGDSGWDALANVNLSHQSSRRTSTRPQVVSGGVITGATPLDIQDASTKVNARIGFTMPNEKVTVEFWGLNLTDEITRGITFNTPLQGASRSAFIEAPRQYGVTLRTRF
jgi:outer membrane receptor protein involved in Fe transport